MAPPAVCSTTTAFHTFPHGAPAAARLAADELTAKPAPAPTGDV